MKKINPYNHDINEIFQNIMAPKKQEDKDIFTQVKKRVSERIQEYKDNQTSLENIVKESWNAEQAALLASLYKSGTVTWIKVKTEIKKLSVNGKCVYCDLGEVDPLEHYLPKKIFPEFAVFCLNLFPCCTKCNRYKYKNWVDEKNKRLFLNFYFDNIDHTRFLYCQINYVDNVPVPRFYLEFKSETALSSLCRTHFERLHLAKRYAGESNGMITSIKRAIYNHKDSFGGDFSRRNVITYLRNDAENYANEYGQNNWRTALLEGLINCSEFLEELKQKEQE